jgi:hypothetical protein
MQNITTVAELKNAIEILEVRQEIKGQRLKEQIYLTYESLKPVNLIRNGIKEIFSPKILPENFSGSAMGMAGGLLFKKILVGKSGNIFRKLFGSVVQYGISNFVAQNAESIKAVSHAIFDYLLPKKK